MTIEALRRLTTIIRPYPRLLSAEERSFQTDKVLTKFQVGNSDILLMLIAEAGGINEHQVTELAAVYEDYARTFPTDHVPVTELARTAGIVNLPQNAFLGKFCLNYRRGIGGRERHQEALARLMNGQAEKDSLGNPKGVSFNDPDYLGVAQWMLSDIDQLMRLMHHVTENAVFDPISQTRVRTFRLSKYNSGRDSLYELLINKYNKIFPLLEADEIIEPAPSSAYYTPAKAAIVRGVF